jgi:DNA-binding NarL/FixJ family response regulator
VPKHNTSGAYPKLSSWEVDRTDRLIQLFSTASALRSDSRSLVNQIRGSLTEMRELRGKLREQGAQFKTAETNGNARPQVNASPDYGLTRREYEVARLLAEGRSNAAIARELQISAHTARHHTQRVLSKLKVHSRAAAGAKLRW